MLSKGHRRKQQIIDTAKNMFIESGFQSTHIGKVCEALNIARGTVYQYFGNKREILYAILESAEEAIDDIMDTEDMKEFMKSAQAIKNAPSYISDRVTAAINTIINEPIILKLIFREIIGIDEGVVTRINEFINHITKAIMLDIDEIVKKGYARKGVEPDSSALMLIGGVLFIIKNQEAQNKEKISKEVFDSITSTYVKGLFKQ